MGVYIIGAGLSGMSCAYELSKNGVSPHVFEKDKVVGGMAKSKVVDGFTYDLGPHRFHSSDTELMDHIKGLLGDNLLEKDRVSRILLEGKFFDYPLRVSNAIFNMPPFTMVQILFDYVAIKGKNVLKAPEDNNFEQWVMSRFGKKLYDIYFKVYTEKTWGMPCTNLSADWAAQRISLLSLWDTFVKTIRKSGDTPRTYVSRFIYPETGGIQSICDCYADHVLKNGGKIESGKSLTSVKVEGDNIISIGFGKDQIEVGTEDIVMSTIPLTDFVDVISPKAPAAVQVSCEKLVFRSIVFVHLVINKAKVSDDHWIYLPELRYVSNRLSETKNFSVKNAPDGKTMVGFEITCQVGDDIWNADDETLKKIASEDFIKTGLVEEKDIVDAKISRIEHAYPIYDLDYREHLDTVLNYLKTIKNLKFFGRNGLFRYNNMDHSIGMGLTAARSVTDENINYMAVATEQNWFG